MLIFRGCRAIFSAGNEEKNPWGHCRSGFQEIDRAWLSLVKGDTGGERIKVAQGLSDMKGASYE